MRILLWLCLSWCSLFSFAQNEYSILSLPPELKKNADAVVRLHSNLVDIQGRDALVQSSKRVVTVLRKAGNGHTNAVVFYDDSRKIKDLVVRIYDALGNEIEKFKERDFKDISAVDGISLYTDSRLKYLEYTPTSYPYTFEMSYELHTKNTGFLPNWYFLSAYQESVMESNFEIRYAHPDLKPVIAEKNLEGLEVDKNEGPGLIRYQARHLPALKKEPYSGPLTSWAPRLMARLDQFHYEGFDGDMSDWARLGDWMQTELLEGRTELPEATRAQIRSLVAGISDPIERARKVYAFVQEQTRYISVQVGIGGIQPIAASEVDRLKYGDCKGLTNYTMALLDAVAVPSYYCVVEAGEEKVDFDPEFSDLRQGNHVILAIPDGDDYHWLDCTSKTNPFGFLGTFTDDRLVQMIREDGGSLVRTPAYLDDHNHLRTEAELALQEDGSLQGQVRMHSLGTQYEDHAKLERVPSDEVERHYREYWSYVNNLEVLEYAFEHDKDSIRFDEQLQLKVANYATPTGDLLFVHPNVLNRFQHIPDRVLERTRDFRIPRGFADADEFRLVLPDTYALEALPDPQEITSPFGQYRMEIRYEEASHSLVYQREMRLDHGQHDKESYRDFREFCRNVARADNAQVILKKKQV